MPTPHVTPKMPNFGPDFGPKWVCPRRILDTLGRDTGHLRACWGSFGAMQRASMPARMLEREGWGGVGVRGGVDWRMLVVRTVSDGVHSLRGAPSVFDLFATLAFESGR